MTEMLRASQKDVKMSIGLKHKFEDGFHATSIKLSGMDPNKWDIDLDERSGDALTSRLLFLGEIDRLAGEINPNDIEMQHQ